MQRAWLGQCAFCRPEQVDRIAAENGIEGDVFVEKSPLEIGITKAFDPLFYILNQRGAHLGQCKSFYEEMVQSARNNEILLHTAIDKEKSSAPQEMHSTFEQVKQAYRAGLLVATTIEPLSYEDAMAAAKIQLDEKTQRRGRQ